MNKRLPLSFLSTLLCLLFTATIYAQTTEEDDCDDCPTEVEEVVLSDTTPKKVVTADSLFLLQDKNSAVNERKFKAKFKDRYNGKPEFTYVKVEKKEGLFNRIKQAIRAWYYRNFVKQVGQELNHFYYVVFLRVLGFFILGLVIYYLAKAFIQKDIYWMIKKKGKKISALENITTEDFKTTNFEQLVAEALEHKQYRLSIRLYYLWLLQRLQEEQKIVWAPEKTNADYIYELKGEREREEFSYLSYLYNNIWYGEYELTDEEFFKAKNSFDLKLKNK